MRRGRCLPALAALAALAAPTNAMAMGAVVGHSGELVSLSSERIAVATATTRTTRWAQVTVTGASGGFAWLVPVRPGARLDLASDAWLDALDAATAPVILPPATPGCIGGSHPDVVTPMTSPSSTSPTQVEILTDLPSLRVLLNDAGYPLPSELATKLSASLSSGNSIAALLFPTATLPTHTLRVVDDGAPSLPFALSGSAFGDLTVTGFILASGPEAAGTMPITIDPSMVLWLADAQSTYAQAGIVLVQESQGTRWLTQSSMPGLLFAGASIASTSALPSVLAHYFTLAASYGDVVNNPRECVAASTSTRNDTGSYVATCPDGALAIVDGPSPCVIDGADSIGVDSLSCGGNSVDAALAVADLSPQGIWVTRLEGMVTLESAGDVPLVEGPATSAGPGGSLSPVLTAGGYDCPGASGGGGGGGGGGDPGGGATLGPGDPGSSGASTAADVASNGCAAGMESCSSSSDSSDSSDDSGGCGSSDSSSSDSGGCSGSDAGGSGSGCSSDGGGSSCTTARQLRHHHRGRSPVSRLLLLGAAVAIVARRRSRQ